MVEDLVMATLIGDIVDSKRHAARGDLQVALTSVLARTNEQLQPLQPLEPTVGDEFQGGFATISDAALASLVVRLSLLTHGTGADSRYGLGWGTVTVFERQREPTSQDGPGWWTARAAIDRAKRLAVRPRTSFARTCFEAPPLAGVNGLTESAALDAFFLCRDAAVSQMNERQHRLLLGLVVGLTQEELASDEGITQSAVSQALRRTGALAIEAAHHRLAKDEG